MFKSRRPDHERCQFAVRRSRFTVHRLETVTNPVVMDTLRGGTVNRELKTVNCEPFFCLQRPPTLASLPFSEKLGP